MNSPYPQMWQPMAVGGTPWETKAEARQLVPHSGFIPGIGGGRSDTKPMSVKKGAYIIPSDILSGVGGGNTNAGANAFNKLFNMGPYGAAVPHIRGAALKTAKPIRQRFADGGMMDEGNADIVASDGEFAVPPEKLIEKFGDLDKAHNVLDRLVHHVRRKTIKKLKSLPSPKKK